MTRRRAKVSKSDVELAAHAKAAVGGPAKLAEMFHVSKQAASEWGRVRPVPRHLRPRLEQLVPKNADADEGLEEGVEDTPWSSLGGLLVGTGLQLTPPPDDRRSSAATARWREMTEEKKNELRNYVRRGALVASAVQQLLSDDSALRVITTLSTEVSARVNNDLLTLRDSTARG